MNEQTERISLISRLFSTGVFKPADRGAMRQMSINTLRELTKTVGADRLPQVKYTQSPVLKASVVIPDESAKQMLPPSLGDIVRGR